MIYKYIRISRKTWISEWNSRKGKHGYGSMDTEVHCIRKYIVYGSMDTGAYCIVKKCTEVVFKEGKKVIGQRLEILKEKMKALDPDLKEKDKFLEFEQVDDIDVKRVMEKVKKETSKKMEKLVSMNLM